MLWWWKLILYHYCCLYFGRKIHTKYKKKCITSFIKFNAGFLVWKHEKAWCIRLAFNDLLGFQKWKSADFLGHLLCWSLGALIQEWHTLWLAFKVAFVFEHRMRCTQPRIRRGILPLTKCIKEFNKYCLEKKWNKQILGGLKELVKLKKEKNWTFRQFCHHLTKPEHLHILQLVILNLISQNHCLNLLCRMALGQCCTSPQDLALSHRVRIQAWSNTPSKSFCTNADFDYGRFFEANPERWVTNKSLDQWDREPGNWCCGSTCNVWTWRNALDKTWWPRENCDCQIRNDDDGLWNLEKKYFT